MAPPPARAWSEPFFNQAREDLRAAWIIANSAGSDTQVPASTLCMVLQMVFEKIAKGAEFRAGNTPGNSHKIVDRLFLLLARHRLGREIVIKYSRTSSFVRELEAAQPAIAKSIAGTPQLEYPWDDQAGGVRWAGADLALVKRITDPKDRVGVEALRMAEALIKVIPDIIP
jgi:hypothetical protein